MDLITLHRYVYLLDIPKRLITYADEVRKDNGEEARNEMQALQ